MGLKISRCAEILLSKLQLSGMTQKEKVTTDIVLDAMLKFICLLQPTEPYRRTSQGAPEKEKERQQPMLPWVSATGRYQYAAVAADAEICSQIGT